MLKASRNSWIEIIHQNRVYRCSPGVKHLLSRYLVVMSLLKVILDSSLIFRIFMCVVLVMYNLFEKFRMVRFILEFADLLVLIVVLLVSKELYVKVSLLITDHGSLMVMDNGVVMVQIQDNFLVNMMALVESSKNDDPNLELRMIVLNVVKVPDDQCSFWRKIET